MKDWHDNFDERQRQLIENCRTYARNDPVGVPGHSSEVPGHNLALIIAKFAFMADTTEDLIKELVGSQIGQAEGKLEPFEVELKRALERLKVELAGGL